MFLSAIKYILEYVSLHTVLSKSYYLHLKEQTHHFPCLPIYRLVTPCVGNGPLPHDHSAHPRVTFKQHKGRFKHEPSPPSFPMRAEQGILPSAFIFLSLFVLLFLHHHPAEVTICLPTCSLGWEGILEGEGLSSSYSSLNRKSLNTWWKRESLTPFSVLQKSQDIWKTWA